MKNETSLSESGNAYADVSKSNEKITKFYL